MFVVRWEIRWKGVNGDNAPGCCVTSIPRKTTATAAVITSTIKIANA